MDQHVRCLYADAHDTGEEMNHDMRLVLRSLLQALRTGLLNLLDLVHDEPQAGHVATKFEQRVRRGRDPLGGPQRCETVRRLAQRGLEGPNPEADQTPLHPVDQARALTDEPLALTVRALGILLRQRRNGRHVAVIGFAAQPADEDPFEQSRVEAICFRPAMLARDSHAGRVDDVGFDIAGPEPARQPEPVAARLERDHDARNRATLLGCLGTPAHQQPEQVPLAWFELLQRMALDPWNNASDEPARLAHLNHRNDRAVLLQGSEGPTQIVELLCHGTLHRVASSDDGDIFAAVCPIASQARPSGTCRTACPSRSSPRSWRCLPARPGRDGIASSCSGSTAPAGTPHRTWSCRTGSGSPTCPRTPPSFSPPSTSGPFWMSRSRTATLRPSPIWNARSQTVAGSSTAISSASGQTSIGGPSQPPRANQPEMVSHLGWLSDLQGRRGNQGWVSTTNAPRGT